MKRKIESLRELQLIQLDMLREFDGFCRQNNINYCFAGGSALGAIRHQGFIPWDDDIDIFITRPNYEKLLERAKDGISEHCVLNCPEWNPEFLGYIPKIELIGSIVKMGTIKVEHDIQLGLSLFVCDGVSKYKWIQKCYFRKMYVYKALYALTVNNLELANSSLARKAGPALAVFFKSAKSKKYRDKILKLMKKYPYEKSVMIAPTADTRAFWEVEEKSIFEQYSYVDFEGEKYPVRGNCKKYLERYYGDYMALPPKEEQIGKHDIQVWVEEK
ncbi:MAG: hypothetical protein HDR00_15665 [Lachnospiraceae bacterium]|nr:hypothetical protein [Lachnospiraceae bacterium]